MPSPTAQFLSVEEFGMVAAASWLAPSECRFVNLFPNHLGPASIFRCTGGRICWCNRQPFSHLLLDNVMRSDPLFSSERSFYDEFLTFCFRIDDFSARTRLMNADAILLETLNRLCVSGSVSKRSDQIRNPSALTTGCYFRAPFLQRRSEHQACGRQKVMGVGFRRQAAKHSRFACP